MKKFNDNRNVIGDIIKTHREQKKLTKTDLSHKLELLGIELDRFELYKIETFKKSVKDFELIAFCIILDIELEELKKQIEEALWYVITLLFLFVTYWIVKKLT